MNKSGLAGMLLIGTFFLPGEMHAQLFRRGSGVQRQQYPAQLQQNQRQQQLNLQSQGGISYPQQSGGTAVNGVVQNGQVRNGVVHQHWSQTLMDASSREHDFGNVAKLSRQEHVFEFVNPLDTDLYLEGASASCRCTQPKILTPVVKPGETAKILAAFDTRGFEGQKGATVRVRLRRNSPYFETAELQVSVRGMIRRDIVTEPGDLNFGNIRLGSQGKHQMIVKYAGDPAWSITNAECSSDKLKVTVAESMRDASRRRVDYQVVIETSPDLTAGDINEQLVLNTTDPSVPTIVIPVTGRVRTGIEASDIRLGTIEQGKKIERMLVVRGDSAFAITGVNSSVPSVSFEPVENVYKPVHTVRYQLNTSQAGNVDGEIMIRTTDSLQPELKLAIKAEVVPATYASGIGGSVNEVASDNKE